MSGGYVLEKWPVWLYRKDQKNQGALITSGDMVGFWFSNDEIPGRVAVILVVKVTLDHVELFAPVMSVIIR
ncbi:hypothetical protein GCM10008997_40200 [Halomonas salifodinae]